MGWVEDEIKCRKNIFKPRLRLYWYGVDQLRADPSILVSPSLSKSKENFVNQSKRSPYCWSQCLWILIACSQIGLLSSLEQLLGELHLHCLASRGTMVPVMVIVGGVEDDLDDTIEDEIRPNKGLYDTFRRKYIKSIKGVWAQSCIWKVCPIEPTSVLRATEAVATEAFRSGGALPPSLSILSLM